MSRGKCPRGTCPGGYVLEPSRIWCNMNRLSETKHMFINPREEDVDLHVTLFKEDLENVCR